MNKFAQALVLAALATAAAPAGAAPLPASAEHVAASGDTRRVTRAPAPQRVKAVFKVPARLSRMASVDQLMLRMALRPRR